MTFPPKTDTPHDFAKAAELLAQPMAVMAAGAMMGFALTTQAFGLWMSAAMSASEAMRQSNGGRSPGSPDTPAADQTGDVRAEKVAAPAKKPAGEAPQARNVVPMRRVRVAPAHSRVVTATRPAGSTASRAKVASKVVDDLKAISGIGPKLEQVLHAEGISTYAQLASLSAGEVTSLEKKFGMEGRIARDEWQKQASLLAAKN